MSRWVWGTLLAVGFVLLLPLVALAHNCGSPSDCWNAGGAAAAGAAGAGAAAAAAAGAAAAGRDPYRPLRLGDLLRGLGGGDVTVGPEGGGYDIELKDPNRDGDPDPNIDNLSPEMRATFDDIVETFRENGAPTPVITSGNDGRHGRNSLHYQDQAVDLRGNNLADPTQDQIATDLQQQLGNDYDVVSEHFPNNPANDHIHVEYDPE